MGLNSAHGTEFRIGSTADTSSTSITYTSIGFIGDIEGPEETVGFTEVTHHGSSAVERIPNLNDSGTVTAELRYESTNALHTSTDGALVGLLQNRTKRAVRIVMPSTVGGESVAEMSGWFSSVSNSFPAGEGVISRDFEYQIDGTVSWSTST